MKRTLNSLALSFLLAMAANPAVLANPHGGGHSASHEASLAAQEAVIGVITVDGVSAEAILSDVREAMAKAGQPATHHLRIAFTDLATNRSIESGLAAVKVTLPGGEELEAGQLLGMDGHFGADLQLTRKGKHTFAVGTRLGDGTKRQFVFTTEVK